MKKIKNAVILGSTGSIGRQALEVIRKLKTIRIISLAAHSNYRLLFKQAEEFRPRCVCITDPYAYLKAGSQTRKLKILPPEKFESLVDDPKADIILAGNSGSRALEAIHRALKNGLITAVANKEPVVMAGDILMKTALRLGGRIVPVDSEHSAIARCLENRAAAPEKIYITSSGGSLLKNAAKKITPEIVLAHPVWKMGRKITVDSSTGINKGLEVIEAHHLFGLPFSKINVVLHPQALVHGMVEYADGGLIGFISEPDMRLPIAHALAPGETSLVKRVSFERADMTFREFPVKKFPCFSLAVAAGKKGGLYPSALCGANETAVSAFLSRKISFAGIPSLIEKTLSKTPKLKYNIKNAIAVEKWAEEYAESLL